MSSRVRVVAIVCIAVFAFTVITGAPMLALLDAETPVVGLFAILVPAPPPAAQSSGGQGGATTTGRMLAQVPLR